MAGGAWKVAYADFVTAMMALFMVLWISAQEPHYPLRLGGGNASGSGNLNFTYNVPVQVAAPKNAVDLSRGAAGL